MEGQNAKSVLGMSHKVPKDLIKELFSTQQQRMAKAKQRCLDDRVGDRLKLSKVDKENTMQRTLGQTERIQQIEDKIFN